MEFVKMHGVGNDYIFVDCFRQKIENPQDVAIAISHRHFGVGSDGLVLILPSGKADCQMRMFNADGSEGKMCGNAIRCVGKYFYENISNTKKNIAIETLSGTKNLNLIVEFGKVSSAIVNMGKADFLAKNVPFITDSDEFVNQQIALDNMIFDATVLSMGNPHCVTFVDDIASVDIEKNGRKIETSPMFPDRTNVEFVQLLDNKTIVMRVWERGSGQTMACGTGACASVAAAVKGGILMENTEITVKLLGGELFITCLSNYEMVMRGAAVEVFRGSIDV